MHGIGGSGRCWRAISFHGPLLLALCCGLMEPSVHAATHYVRLSNINASAPYTNWNTAATDIQSAIDVATGGDGVLVSNGTYFLTAALSVTQGVSVRSVAGAGETIVDGNQVVPCLRVTHGDAVLDGFTLRNGSNRTDHGGGVYMETGLVRNCTIVSNWAMSGGGVYLNGGGTVSNCTVGWNVAGGAIDWMNGGAGAYCVRGGLLADCLIVSNSAVARGGGIRFCTNGVASGCILVGNSGRNWGTCAARFDWGGLMTNCVIAGHKAVDGGGIMRFSYPPEGILNDCTIRDNESDIDGGQLITDVNGNGTTNNTCGVFVNCRILNNISPEGFGGCHLFSNCVIAANQATNGSGGGISVEATVVGCVIVSNYASQFGGGVSMNGGTMVQCMIAGNMAGRGGGGLNGNSGFVSNCTFAGNTAGAGPGGINLNGGTMVSCMVNGNTGTNGPGGVDGGGGCTIRGCIITNNAAVGGSGFAGGVGLNFGSQLLDSTVCGNRAAQMGGGVSCNGGRVANCTIAVNTARGGAGLNLNGGILEDSVVTGNTATNGSGGGVFCSSTGLVRRCLILRNTASGSGGGIEFFRSGMIDNCTIQGNSAFPNGGGGGLDCSFGGSATNCLVVGNRAGWGGGIKCNQGGAVMNCTISSNTANQGGGAQLDNVASLVNCIVKGNFSGNGVEYYAHGTGIVFSYTCTQPDPGGTGNISSNPLFVNSAGGDFRVATNSPCVDRGNNEAWMLSALDRDGHPRIVNSRVDMGCYELIPPYWDTDGDTLPDSWEWDYSGAMTNMSAVADDDGDRLNNLGEWMAGTDPTNAACVLAVSGLQGAGTAGDRSFVCQWPAVTGRTYTICWATNVLGELMVLQSNLVATPPVNTYTDTVHAGSLRGFFRVKAAKGGVGSAPVPGPTPPL